VAAMTQVALDSGLQVPTVGASGAIAGVLGAYFVLYPRARVLTWFPPIFFFHLPAWVMLGYWFVLQFLSGAASSIAYSSHTSGGIAFWAHVGGFVAGIALIKILPERPRRYRYGTW
jgi:membrane associated rhomboid family serine protease